MASNICEVGNTFSKTRKLEYLSKNTFLDYNVLILNLTNSGVFNNFHSSTKDIYDKRKNNVIEFLEHKKTPLIAFAPVPEPRYLANHGIVETDYFLPGAPFKVENEIGENIDIVTGTIFTGFLTKYSNYFFYKSFFSDYSGIPILKTPHTKKVIAFYNESIIFLPALKDISKIEEEFLNDLVSIANEVNKRLEDINLPKWANSYLLPNEKTLQEEISSLEEHILTLSESLVSKKSCFKTFEYRKQIFTGTGNELEDEIKKIFSELGFQILEAEPNRDDLIVKYKDQIAVVEIKGINSSAAEKHSNQLEKWVSLYYEKNNVRAKGILIVNSFKEKPISDRKEATFPDQMLKYSINREHCLISSLQLLGFYYKSLETKDKDELVSTLFETNGVYKGFENWSDFIEIK
jgi:hypothetical protein